MAQNVEKTDSGWGNPFKKPRALGFNTSWVKGWTRDEAVRELLQNLFDEAITAPPPTDNQAVVLQDDDDDYLLGEEKDYPTIQGAKRTDVLLKRGGVLRGHIIWAPREELLFLINRKASLPPSALQVGGTTKEWTGRSQAQSGRCAGKHGEGLKAAIATLVRLGSKIEIHQSGGALVFFNKDAGEELSVPSPSVKYVFTDGYGLPQQMAELKQHLADMRRSSDLGANRAGDVIVVVKGIKFTTTFARFFLARSHVEKPDLASLTRPNDYVRLSTSHGDLLWPRPYRTDVGGVRGRVYVAGILWANTRGPPRYGVDFPAGISDDRDRRTIGEHTYGTYMAQLLNGLLESKNAHVMQHRSLVVDTLLQELESTVDGFTGSANAHRHLQRLKTYLSRPSCALLADAFRLKKRNEQQLLQQEQRVAQPPIENFLAPCSGPARERLKKWASASSFTLASPVLYDLFMLKSDFNSEHVTKSKSLANLGRFTASSSWPPRLCEVLESLWPTLVSDRIELRDTGDERCVPSCLWMPKLGKVVVSSSRIRDMNVFKLIKLLNLEMKEMGRALGIDTAPAKLSLDHYDVGASTSAAGASTQHQSSSGIASPAPVRPITPTSTETEDDEDDDDDEGEIEDFSVTTLTVASLLSQAPTATATATTLKDSSVAPPPPPLQSMSCSLPADVTKVVQECQRRREQSDWTQNLLADDLATFRSLEISDAHGQQLLQRLDQRFNHAGTDIPCSSAGFVEICQTDLRSSLPVIHRLEQEVVADLGCTSRVTNCWLDSEVEGFVDDASTVYVNLRPLLLSRRTYAERELFVYLATLISHEVAHVLLPKDGHSAKHGRMSEDLMARLLLKTNRLAAHATATAATAASATATAGSTPPNGGASRKRSLPTAVASAAFSPASSGVARSDKRRRTTDVRSDSSSSASTPTKPTAPQAP